MERINRLAEDTQAEENETIDLKDLSLVVSEELVADAATDGGPSGRAVAIKCRDTIVNVTEAQAAIVSAVFANPEQISSSVLLEALPALRRPVTSSGDQDQSMKSWDVVSMNSGASFGGN